MIKVFTLILTSLFQRCWHEALKRNPKIQSISLLTRVVTYSLLELVLGLPFLLESTQSSSPSCFSREAVDALTLAANDAPAALRATLAHLLKSKSKWGVNRIQIIIQCGGKLGFPRINEQHWLENFWKNNKNSKQAIAATNWYISNWLLWRLQTYSRRILDLTPVWYSYFGLKPVHLKWKEIVYPSLCFFFIKYIIKLYSWTGDIFLTVQV